MIDLPKDFRFSAGIDPPKNNELNLAEYIAHSVLRALIGSRAVAEERSKPGGGQSFINSLSVTCQEAISKAADDPFGDDLKREAMDNVNKLLASVTFK